MTNTGRRQQILQAANRIVQRAGAASLTIDAVAHEVGMSKGGIFYHFPSKEALIEGMLTQRLEGFDEELCRVLEQEKGNESEAEPGRWLRGYIRASSNDPNLAEYETAEGYSLLAAIATDPKLLEITQQSFNGYQQQAEQDGLPPALATIIRLAVDGLMFADMFHLATPEGEQRKAVIQTLLAMTRVTLQTNE